MSKWPMSILKLAITSCLLLAAATLWCIWKLLALFRTPKFGPRLQVIVVIQAVTAQMMFLNTRLVSAHVFFPKPPLQLFFFKWLFYKKNLPVTARYQNTLECLVYIDIYYIIYIAVLLIGPKSNQVFVDFPCGQPGDVPSESPCRKRRPGKAFKSVNVKNAHGPETASRGDRKVMVKINKDFGYLNWR